MLAHGVGQRVPRLHVVQRVLDRLLENRVLGLLREDVEGLHQRETRVDHRRELTREDHDVAGLDLLPLRERDVLRLLADRDGNQLLLAQIRDDVVFGGKIDLGAADLACDRPSAVGPDRHRVSPESVVSRGSKCPPSVGDPPRVGHGPAVGGPSGGFRR